MLRERSTQTNEAGRCAVLLPLLAALPQPVALLEVGASAGLCSTPTCTRTGPATSASAPVTWSWTAGSPAGPVPDRRPGVAWRAGLLLALDGEARRRGPHGQALRWL